jgi:hypothetical protein
MKSKLILAALALVIAGGVVWVSIPKVSAQTTSGKTIIQRLAEKFGAKETDVQSVFDQERTERQSEMQARYEERLTQAVQDGKITAAQKTAILTKHKEMQQERETERTEWQTWLKANGLENSEFGLGFGGKGMGMGGMGRGMHGW